MTDAPPIVVGYDGRAGSQAALDEALGRVTEAQVAVDTELLDRAPADGLLAAADAHDAQMIVVGSTGEGPLRGILVGSTSYKLLHLSARPVLVVRGT